MEADIRVGVPERQCQSCGQIRAVMGKEHTNARLSHFGRIRTHQRPTQRSIRRSAETRQQSQADTEHFRDRFGHQGIAPLIEQPGETPDRPVQTGRATSQVWFRSPRRAFGLRSADPPARLGARRFPDIRSRHRFVPWFSAAASGRYQIKAMNCGKNSAPFCCINAWACHPNRTIQTSVGILPETWNSSRSFPYPGAFPSEKE